MQVWCSTPRTFSHGGWFESAMIGGFGRVRASISGTKVWLTNEYERSGLRQSSAVFERMLALRRELV